MFISKWASTDDRSPFGDFWFEPVSRHSITGQRVGAEQAMRLAAVYACVGLLAKTFAVMPFQLWEPQGAGRKPVTGHWANRLFGRRPNRFQNPFEFRQMLQGHLALRGNAFCEIVEQRGQILELLPKHPDRMKPEQLGNGDYRYRYLEPDGSSTLYARGEIWHLRNLSNNGVMGLNPMELQRDVIGLGLGAQEYGARFFANDATPPGWIEMPSVFADKAKRDTFRESWQNNQLGRNRGKTAVLEGGMKYHQIEVKNSDAQYLESRRFTVSEIARIFGVPPHLIGDLDRATFANIEQQSLEYVLYTMTPIATQWSASIAYSLLNDDDEDEGLQPSFGLEALLQGDRASRADFYMKMFGVGALSTNDIRQKEGDNPVDGGDMRFRPVNLSPLRPEDVAKFPAAAPSKPPRPPGDQNREDPSEARARALAGAAAERIARKELGELAHCGTREAVSNFYGSHARFVGEVLCIAEESARAYCREQMSELGAGMSSTFERETRERLVALALGQS